EIHHRGQIIVEELMKADPCLIVIFGASGDLTKRKLIPALFNLYCTGSLSQFQVLGVGSGQMSDDQFRTHLFDSSTAFKDSACDSEEQWKKYASSLHYKQGDLLKETPYGEVASHIEEMCKKDNACANRLFYFSTPPSLAPSIVTGLGAAGLSKQ